MASRILRPTGQLLKKYSNKATSTQPAVWRSACTALNYEQAIVNEPATKLTVLDNGIRVASEESGGPLATVGVCIDAGARDETESTNGVINLLTRMAFKGSNKRSQADLEAEVGSKGARMSAFTSREQTFYLAQVLPQDVPWAVEVLADIVQNTKYGESELEREKAAVLREIEPINGHLQPNMQGVTMDYLHSIAYQGTPLAKTVVGPTDNIKALSGTQLAELRHAHYTGPRMVVAGAGGVDQASLTDLTKKFFTNVSGSHTDIPKLPSYCRYTGSDVLLRDDSMPVCHLALAIHGVGATDPDNVALQVASTMIGDWSYTANGGVNNASALATVCADGHVGQRFQSFNINYKDTGLWGMYYEASNVEITRLEFNILQRWMDMTENCTDFEVERAKNALRTNLLLQHRLAGTAASCQDIGSQIIYRGRRVPFAELDTIIAAVTASSLRDVLYKYIYHASPVHAAIGPTEAAKDYLNLKAGFYWLRV